MGFIFSESAAEFAHFTMFMYNILEDICQLIPFRCSGIARNGALVMDIWSEEIDHFLSVAALYSG